MIENQYRKIWFIIFVIWAFIFIISAYNVNEEYLRCLYTLFATLNGIIIGFELKGVIWND